MNRGILLFAFNTEQVDYVKMAIATAKRANHFLNLPVSVVTNVDAEHIDYAFDTVIIENADKSNVKNNKVWANKGRYRAFELSPYDETLVLDTDYLINSDTLLKPFDMYHDFMCHNRTSFLMTPVQPPEKLSDNSFETLWATVMYFKKTNRAKHIFQCMEMIQKNYDHYINLYKLIGGSYRNDHALTIALKIANGQTEDISTYIPWNLVHAGTNVSVYRNNETEFNTEYTVLTADYKNKKSYGIVKDFDFHVINKNIFMELVDG